MRSGGGGCQDYLLAKSRVGALSVMERRALDAHLGVCESCRAAIAFGSLFDAIPDRPAAEDDALVRRLADRLASARGVVGTRRRPRALALAAGVSLFIAAGAAAAWVSGHRPAPAPPLAPPAFSSLPRSAPVRVSHPRVATTEPMVSPALVGDDAATSPRARSAPPTRARPARSPVTPSATAAELFARANSMRRSRDFREAIRQYQTLQRLFPESSEARVSLVSTGDLLSREGETAGALAAFDRYLSGGDAGPLAPEALVGRARCLERLARRADELGAWHELLRRFPGSIYEALALRRVDELSR